MQVTSKLEGALAIDFEALHKACGAPKASLLRQALREFIDKALAENKEIAARFARERTKLNISRGAHLRVVK